MKKKLASRKFLVTVTGIITVVANDYFELGLDKETVLSLVTLVASYIVGQGYVDGKKAVRGEF